MRDFWYRLQRLILTITSTTWNKCKFACSGVRVGARFHSCGNIFLRRYGKGEIVLGNSVNINSSLLADPIGGQAYTSLVVSNGGCIVIGNRVGISNASIFSACEVTIGDDTCIGGGVRIYDTDFHSINSEHRLNGNTHVPSAPVHIGKRVFIGGDALILKGVSIGDTSVIGAGSVVTKNVPANEVWAGNPAKFIKKIEQ